MKQINIILILLLIGAVSNAQTPVQIKVDGMSCGFCVNGVEKKFSKSKEVKDLHVDLEKGMVTFNVAKGVKVDKDKYTGLVEKAGYEPRQIMVGDEIKAETVGFAKQINYVPELNGIITSTFKVSGNCEMCKKKIETAAKSVKGVKSAVWDKDTKMITVKYDDKKAKLTDIHNKIASVGYDTDKVKGDDKAYDKLHACCQYDRE